MTAPIRSMPGQMFRFTVDRPKLRTSRKFAHLEFLQDAALQASIGTPRWTMLIRARHFRNMQRGRKHA